MLKLMSDTPINDSELPGITPVPTLSALQQLIAANHITQGENLTTGSYRGYHLQSGFQPIFSLAHERPVGVEALLRAKKNNEFIPPPFLFELAAAQNETLLLDRICRAIHVANFGATNLNPGWLFLNINPHIMLDGKHSGIFFTPEVLDRYGIAPHRVVVEILEKEIKDEGLLVEAVQHYQHAGCLVAVDDFGAGQSNFDRIWRLQPDIVKLDRSIIANAVHNKAARRIFPSLVDLIHEAGCLVLVEGIETETEANITMDSDVDFVQGFFFSRPTINPDEIESGQLPLLHDLSCDMRFLTMDQTQRDRMIITDYVGQFWTCTQALQEHFNLQNACSPMLKDVDVKRFFLLSENGRQIGNNLSAPDVIDNVPPRFQPLSNAEKADWSRRDYYRRAINQPGEIHISGPYFSLPDAATCVTLSRSIRYNDLTYVLCCDLQWHGNTHLITGSVGPWNYPENR
ncbi:MAG: EAL domain-containing protein [Magnetococcales bacterium]|nr:EAL domain-containing protein [Magnetococcales bacterium]